MRTHDDIEQFRDYVADQLYRIHCNVAGVVPLRWMELAPERRDSFRTNADARLAEWMTQIYPKPI